MAVLRHAPLEGLLKLVYIGPTYLLVSLTAATMKSTNRLTTWSSVPATSGLSLLRVLRLLLP